MFEVVRDMATLAREENERLSLRIEETRECHQNAASGAPEAAVVHLASVTAVWQFSRNSTIS